MVMADDPALRDARLRLMKRLETLILQLADVSEIVPESALLRPVAESAARRKNRMARGSTTLKARKATKAGKAPVNTKGTKDAKARRTPGEQRVKAIEERTDGRAVKGAKAVIAKIAQVAKASPAAAPSKYVYFFGNGKADGDRTMKDTLGGKGAGLAEMTNAGLPVPPGFTISTDACNLYYEQGRKLTPEIEAEISRQRTQARERRPARRSARRTTRCSSRCGRARNSRCPG